MFFSMIRKIFGSRNDRILKNLYRQVEQINLFEPAIQALTDDELKAKTDTFKERIKNGESLDKLLAEAFAVVRETSVRVLEMRHFDVQLIGGIVLHQGKIAEMSTGEGKTLMSTLAVYLNTLAGDSVHVVTVNDYLAKRDADWMLPVYDFLGLTVGVIVAGMSKDEKREAYSKDVVYGTNNEFGFDYLRDNMVFSAEDKVQRPLSFAVVDEVDSILIDEARTPLIISGPLEDSSELYIKINKLIPQLKGTIAKASDINPQTKFIKKDSSDPSEGDYSIDEKAKQVFITESGYTQVEQILQQNGLMDANDTLYSPKNISVLHHLNACLRAHALFKKDIDYIIQDNKVVIVDEHTGRTMPGRRWSEGLHQAVEAKEGVAIQSENQTLASITFQNYFRLYDKLSGMTGTADTEAYEFQSIYGLEVVVIPTNKPCVRADNPDLIYLTQKEKFKAIIDGIKNCQSRNQPVLVGTVSIETSEFLSGLLNKEKIKHKVLNAKYHAQEAEIIAQAGKPGAVTIATNMAGRGTDIVLGGNYQMLIKENNEPEQARINELKAKFKESHERVIEAGGLHIIGTERHESRRIDNQLRGRSGRQGDPGSSRFYLSLEDNLMRIFASDRVAGLMRKLGLQEGEAVTHPWVNKAIENAQRKVESRNFDIRKQLLEFDDVINDQRKVIYNERDQLMLMEDVSANIGSMQEDVLNEVIHNYLPPQTLKEQWEITSLTKNLNSEFGLDLPISEWLDQDEMLSDEDIRLKIIEAHIKAYKDKCNKIGDTAMRQFEKSIMLHSLDMHWKEHIAQMDYLRQNIHLRGYAQKDPRQEYKREAFEMFQSLLARVQYDIVSILSKVEMRPEDEANMLDTGPVAPDETKMQFQHKEASVLGLSNQTQAPDAMPASKDNSATTFVNTGKKIGRNEQCPCGSGIKYKHCHGKIAGAAG